MSQSPSVNLIGWTLHSGLFMRHIIYPTQNIIEGCVMAIFPEWELASDFLNYSINTIGHQPEFHQKPGAYGTIPVRVDEITGIDIPILISDGNDENGKKTVAIVAQDPLRNVTKDVMLKPFYPFRQPIVGTPFAFHYNLKNAEKCYSQTEVYRKIIRGLLNKGYNVYITDIWKSWDKNKVTRKKRWGINNPHFICLVNELNMINPDYVILMGNEAQAKFKGKSFKNKLWNHNIQEICVPHPSRAANGTWAKILCKYNPTTKANYIVENIP